MSQLKKFLLVYLFPAAVLSGALFFIKDNLSQSRHLAITACIIAGFLLGIVFSIKLPGEEEVK